MERSGVYRQDNQQDPASRLIFLALAVVAVSLFEVALANRKIGLLTGGFLAEPIAGTGDIVLLFASILVSNLFVASILFLSSAALFSRLKWPPPVILSAATFVSVFPVVLADFVSYELTSYMGDAISFYLLTRIAGGSMVDLVANLSGNQVVVLCVGGLSGFGGLLLAASVWTKYIHLPQLKIRKLPLIACIGLTLVLCITLVGWQAQQSDQLLGALRRFPATRVILSVINQLTDRDKDGYGLFSNPRDPDNHDARIYPYAVDLPGNGIDENGFMGDLPVAAASELAAVHYPPVAFHRKPHFVLIVLESFRADLLFRTVDGVAVTPHLNDLAGRGAFTQHGSSHNGYTIGGLNAILTGTLTNRAGQDSLVDDFKRNGYFTACISAQNETFGEIEKTTGLNRVDYFYDARQDAERRAFPFASAGSLTVPADVLLERLGAFLADARDQPTPLFMYVNLQDLHFPYSHWGTKPIFTERPLARGNIRPENQARLEMTYLNGAANLDAAIGKMLALLKSNLGDNVALLVVADHGESLFDGGFLGHGHHLTDNQMLVPIIACGFPALIEAPMGQREIRQVIRNALAVPADVDQPPAVIEDRSKRIFRYIGSIKRPSMIAWYALDGQTVVDIHGCRWRSGNGAWASIQTMSGMPKDLTALVNYWETLQWMERHP